MPLYEYVCRKCDHPFEALVFGAADETTCPKCESAKVEKQLSAPAPPPQPSPTRGGREGREAASLPMGCNSSGPPCGSACRRFGG